MKRDRRAQGLSVNAIILIVLGVVVLGVMILGFTLGWSNFSQYFSTNNVQSISTACTTACATHSQYDFCSVKRNLNADMKVNGITCSQLATFKGTATDENSADAKNYIVSNNGQGYPDYSKYGIAACPSLCPVA